MTGKGRTGGASDPGRDGLLATLRPPTGLERLPRHLEERYSISVRETAPLDLGVVRVDRRDGPSWVARVFPTTRPVEAAEGDARILQALARQGFPAERCAAPEPVSVHEGQAVLVTEFVDGERAPGRGRTFGVLGALLGALHARTAEARVPTRRGGAWHHIASAGGPREEVDAATALLEAARGRMAAADAGPHAALLEALRGLDDCADLPPALLHPDFVPANAISTPDGGLVMVDWTGAGRGPRLWSLGFLLWAAGARDLRLVDVAASQYRRHVQPEPEELARLASAIGARPLIFGAWGIAAGRRRPAEVAEEIGPIARLAETIAARARRGFEAGAAEDPAGADATGG